MQHVISRFLYIVSINSLLQRNSLVDCTRKTRNRDKKVLVFQIYRKQKKMYEIPNLILKFSSETDLLLQTTTMYLVACTQRHSTIFTWQKRLPYIYIASVHYVYTALILECINKKLDKSNE